MHKPDYEKDAEILAEILMRRQVERQEKQDTLSAPSFVEESYDFLKKKDVVYNKYVSE